mmetsp:Transcript_8951/g.25999  ORF Transcript_8951/g.25999 Transcript_8951/m.25999 type:complete len:1001 (-) Transcript_8951:442-3444(-)|eukprot:CAMPEP_0118859686 /NCGR_PEP_ID=MMETSP1163-20130328/5830_1 /TAXON_ID=124430 /ORGANISM="Phaeomonas parva, Strain CCMP2877" /LENGTH=1000 /DNA_ID=CAMNT_0006793311 /DNA_START=108 /DNA_END=3110 /DNA_ORIENTATION=-
MMQRALARSLRASATLATARAAPARALSSKAAEVLRPRDDFLPRHLGPSDTDAAVMLKTVGYGSLDELVEATVPAHIRLPKDLELEPALTEQDALAKIKAIASKNHVKTNLIGAGYHECVTPPVVLRNMLENPGWYTAYTPYQAEISQGRLEMLLNYQTMVSDLTGMEMANASLLDEATAAAEAMNMAVGVAKKRSAFFVAEDCHPQTIALMQTRGNASGVEVVVGNPNDCDFASEKYAGVLLQYPNTYGEAGAIDGLVERAHAHKTLVVCATDLLALTMMASPGDMGADIAVGSAQRFGVPLGFGGPHAGFIATSGKYSRRLPGRIIGVSVDSNGDRALRMAMQTREQHIRRDKATSNICTAQALLANMAASYGIYHGPEGVKAIAERVHLLSETTKAALASAGVAVSTATSFDTFTVTTADAAAVVSRCGELDINLRQISADTLGVSFGEPHGVETGVAVLKAFGVADAEAAFEAALVTSPNLGGLERSSEYMTHPVFNTHKSETQMLRYLKNLENKDLALNTSMISLGSCTMKLNSTSEMMPVTWPEFGNIHPFAPEEQWEGYKELIESLHEDLAKITGFAACSTQPNSGAQGEYAGLLTIRDYHAARGESHRDICIIPVSAHGTNPASAVMCGMKVVVVASDDMGNVDMEDLKAKVAKHSENLGALMITYPSTYGVFEEGVKEICDLVHANGGQIYMDGANMNAQVGLTSPGAIGADVCHLNLHKTFCIPHGGGGPGVGTIAVAEHLAPYLPGHPVVEVGGEGANVVPKATGAVAAAPFGSAGILPIPWMYIKMLGADGLKKATEIAILNANYMAARLNGAYNILYTGRNNTCAHEFIIDLRGFKEHGIVEEDVAKRLQDYGFHSPTMSWPVGGTIMVEPTESEDKAELDRFCDAMLQIREEIEDIIQERVALADSPLTNAPHTLKAVTSEEWTKPYTRQEAAFPVSWVAGNKFWPTVGRIDNAYGDRNLVCTCPPVEDFMEEEEPAAELKKAAAN